MFEKKNFGHATEYDSIDICNNAKKDFDGVPQQYPLGREKGGRTGGRQGSDLGGVEKEQKNGKKRKRGLKGVPPPPRDGSKKKIFHTKN